MATTATIPSGKLPNSSDRLIDEQRRGMDGLRRWMVFVDTAVRRAISGVNGTSGDAATAQATADAALPKAGGTMTGPLVMSGAAASMTVASMTTTQKNALTAVNGMIVYDSTLGKFQGYEAGAWVNLV